MFKKFAPTISKIGYFLLKKKEILKKILALSIVRVKFCSKLEALVSSIGEFSIMRFVYNRKTVGAKNPKSNKSYLRTNFKKQTTLKLKIGLFRNMSAPGRKCATFSKLPKMFFKLKMTGN